jgi:hypothetical protein
MREKKIKSFLSAHLGLFGKSERTNKQEAKAWTKTMDCVFLGYDIHSVGYRFLIINSSVPEMAVDTIMKSRDATFLKINFP